MQYDLKMCLNKNAVRKRTEFVRDIQMWSGHYKLVYVCYNDNCILQYFIL